MSKFSQAFEAFKSGKTTSIKRGPLALYAVTPNAIVSRHWDDKHNGQAVEEVLAFKTSDGILGNSSMLSEFLRSDAYTDVEKSRRGRVSVRAVVSPEQVFLSERVSMIPFAVLKQAGLSVSSYREIDRTPDETVKRRETRAGIKPDACREIQARADVSEYSETSTSSTVWEYNGNERYEVPLFHVSYMVSQHFAGARLFSVNGTDSLGYQYGKRVFLLDLDRGELPHGRINPFLVELKDTSVKTVAEAYQSLKPAEVLDAESKGIPVLRQGEWFFIPLDELTEARAHQAHEAIVSAFEKRDRTQWRGNTPDGRGFLRAGQNRPNQVERFVELEGKHFVSGVIHHTGREHEDLDLRSFHLAVPNTSITSWTITGDLD